MRRRRRALAGFAFNVLLIARAPLQLFQAIQTSILPHLTRLAVTGESDPFRRSVQITLRAVAVFASGVALALLVFGPTLMRIAFGGDFHYGRGGLVVVAVGMGLYLSAATLNQAALAQAKARQAASFWVLTAAVFIVFLLIPGSTIACYSWRWATWGRRPSVRPAVRALPQTGQGSQSTVDSRQSTGKSVRARLCRLLTGRLSTVI